MIIKRNEDGWYPADRSGAGVKTLLSWSRLEQRLKTSGEVQDFERIVQLEMTPNGIVYTVETIK